MNYKHIPYYLVGSAVVLVLSFIFASRLLAGQNEQIKLIERREELLTTIASSSEEYRVTAAIKAEYQQSCDMLASAERQLRHLNSLNTERRRELSDIEAKLEKLQALK